jgi:unspecific monooxygenase
VSDTAETTGVNTALIAATLGFDPFDPVFKADPYPTYRQLREDGPLTRSPAGLWRAASYELCWEVLRNNAFGIGAGELITSQFVQDPDGNTVRPFIFADPPDHTRLRSLASKALSPARVEGLRPRARQLAAELLATARRESRGGPFDLVAALADPLPSTLIRELTGVPTGDSGPFIAWSKALGRGLDPDILLPPSVVAERQEARSQMHGYFRKVAAQRRAEPADDLVSALVHANEDGDTLTETEILVTCQLVVGAGEVTTVNLIGLATLSLLRNPDQLAWLRAHPDQIADAVEELLRYDGPSQIVVRQALRDTTIGATPVSAGEPVMMFFGGANRDPAVYADPERLDLSRPRGRAIGFGAGIHFCLGAPLARLATQEALKAIITLDLELATDQLSWVANGVGLRGLVKLPVIIR